MSMSQFRKWLGEHGVTKGPHCYMIPSKGVVLSAEDTERRLKVTITTGSRDRHGDILEPGGAQIAAYLKNPVVLWAHEYKALPIGRATSIVRDGDTLKAEILFAPTEFAREVYALYAKGFLRAWSVGFLPLEWEVIEDDDGKFAGYHVRSWELVELSAVPVPANPEALTGALKKGLVRAPELKEALLNAVSALEGNDRRSETHVRRMADKPDIRLSGKSEADVSSRPSDPPASAGRQAGADEPDEPAGRRAGKPHAPEMALPQLAQALASKLLVKLRLSLGETVAREIRRQQGRLD